MRSFRTLAVGIVGLSLALAGGATAWLTAADAALASTTRAQPRLEPNGVNFSMHSVVDPNFCVEDTPAPGNPASEAEMSQCAVRDNQHWTFAHAADGSVVIIGGTAGNCLSFSATVRAPVSMTPCTFGPAEHFTYSAKGQIKSTSGTQCLEAEAASQGAEMFSAKCKKGVELQIFQLSH
jgi:Ricin-type beta-trefoil lectin domain